MITLFGMSSPNVAKIAIMLEETGTAYQARHINVASGEQFQPGFIAASPNGKVPYINDDDTGISLGESGAILIYLAEKTGKFLPTEPIARATTLYWLMVQIASIGPNFGQTVHFTRRAPAGQTYSIARFATEMRRCLGVLETRLQTTPYLAGDYSIADIATFPWVRTATTFLPKDVRPNLADTPALAHWFAAIAARPAVIAADMVIADLQKHDVIAFSQATEAQLDRFSGRTAGQT